MTTRLIELCFAMDEFEEKYADSLPNYRLYWIFDPSLIDQKEPENLMSVKPGKVIKLKHGLYNHKRLHLCPST